MLISNSSLVAINIGGDYVELPFFKFNQLISVVDDGKDVIGLPFLILIARVPQALFSASTIDHML